MGAAEELGCGLEELSPDKGLLAWFVPTKQKLSCFAMEGYLSTALEWTHCASTNTLSSLEPKVPPTF
jgi:hypothetical protein